MSATPTSSPATSPRRLIVAITGATGAVYAITLLRLLRQLDDVEIHLVVSDAAWLTIAHESDISKDELRSLAHHVHAANNIGASIASGSFLHHGMMVVPCSMKTLSAIAHGYSDNLISRAADVCLKENRPLSLMVRETPLSAIHLRNMLAVREAGGIIFPPVPAFYHRPVAIEDIVVHSVVRLLDQHGIHLDGIARWQEA